MESRVLIVHVELQNSNIMWEQVAAQIMAGYVPRLYALNYPTLTKDLPPDLRPASLAQLKTADPASNTAIEKLMFLRDFCSLVSQRLLIDPKKQGKQSQASLPDSTLVPNYHVVLVANFHFMCNYSIQSSNGINRSQGTMPEVREAPGTPDALDVDDAPDVSLQKLDAQRLQPHEQFVLDCASVGVCFGAVLILHENMNHSWIADSNFKDLLLKLGLPINYVKGTPPQIVNYSLFTYRYSHSEKMLRVRTVPFFHLKNQGKYTQFYLSYLKHEKISSIPAKDEKVFLTKVKDSFNEQLLANAIIQNDFVRIINTLLLSPKFYQLWMNENKVSYLSDLDFCCNNYYHKRCAQGLKHIRYRRVSKALLPADGVYTISAGGDGTKSQAKSSKDQKEKDAQEMVILPTMENFYEDKLILLSQISNGQFVNTLFSTDLRAKLNPLIFAKEMQDEASFVQSVGVGKKVLTKEEQVKHMNAHIYTNIFAAEVPTQESANDEPQNSQKTIIAFLLSGYLRDIEVMPIPDQNRISVITECMLRQFSALDGLLEKAHSRRLTEFIEHTEEQEAGTRSKSNQLQRSGSKPNSSAGGATTQQPIVAVSAAADPPNLTAIVREFGTHSLEDSRFDISPTDGLLLKNELGCRASLKDMPPELNSIPHIVTDEGQNYNSQDDQSSTTQQRNYFTARLDCPVSLHTEPLAAMLEASLSNQRELLSMSSAILAAATIGTTSLSLYEVQKADPEQNNSLNKFDPTLLDAFFGVMPHRISTVFESTVKVSDDFHVQVECFVEADVLSRQALIDEIRLKAASYDLASLISVLARLDNLYTTPSSKSTSQKTTDVPSSVNSTPESVEVEEEHPEKLAQINYFQMHVNESSVFPESPDRKETHNSEQPRTDESLTQLRDKPLRLALGTVILEFLHPNVSFTVLCDLLSNVTSYTVSSDASKRTILLGVLSDVHSLENSNTHLFAQFKNDIFSLFNTIPTFSVWINSPLVQSVLTSESFIASNYPRVWRYEPEVSPESRPKSNLIGRVKEENPTLASTENTKPQTKEVSLVKYIPLLPSIVPLNKRYRIPDNSCTTPAPGSSSSYDLSSIVDKSMTEVQQSSIKNVPLPKAGKLAQQGAKELDNGGRAGLFLRDTSVVESSVFLEEQPAQLFLTEYARPLFPLPSEYVDISSISPKTHFFLGSTGSFTNINMVITECFGSVGLASKFDIIEPSTDVPQSFDAIDQPSNVQSDAQQAPEVILVIPNQILAVHIQEPEQLQLPEDDEKKRSQPLFLDTSLLPDFDVSLDTLATEFDLRSADMRGFSVQYSTKGIIHCIESTPTSGKIVHKIFNASGLFTRISLHPMRFASVVVSNISEPFSPTPEISLQYAERCVERMIHNGSKPDTGDSSMQRSVGGAKTKKDRERESLQQIEWRRRKRKLVELKALVDEEKARRSQMLPSLGTPVYGIRPMSSYMHLSLAARDLHVTHVGNKILIRYLSDLLVFLYVGQQRFKVTKVFTDVDLNSLEVSADSDPWDSLLYEFKQRYTGKVMRFPIIRLSYEIRRSLVRVYAEFPTNHYAVYVDLDEAGNIEDEVADILSSAANATMTSMLCTNEKTFSIPEALAAADLPSTGVIDHATIQALPPQSEVDDEQGNPEPLNDNQLLQTSIAAMEDNLYEDVARKNMLISQTDRLTKHFSTSYIVIFTCPTRDSHKFFEKEVLNEPPMPCTGTRILNSGNTYYAKGIHARLNDPEDVVRNHELTTMDLSIIVPYIFSPDRVMLHYYTCKNILTIAHLSEQLSHKGTVETLQTSKNFVYLNDKYHFENIVSNTFTVEKQILHEDPARFVQTLRTLCEKDMQHSLESPTIYIQLPIGIFATFNEYGQMNIVYNSISGTDTFSIDSDGLVQTTLGDVNRLGFFRHNSDYYTAVSTAADKRLTVEAALAATDSDIYTYKLTTQPEIFSAAVNILAGYPQPGFQFRTIGRDPYQFLPYIWQIFRQDEKLPRSLVHFTPGVTQIVPSGDDEKRDKESVLHTKLLSPDNGTFALELLFCPNETQTPDAETISVTLRLLKTEFNNSQAQSSVHLSQIVSDQIYLEAIYPVISCTNPLQRAVPNYSLPDYISKIGLSKYKVIDRKANESETSVDGSASDEMYFGSNKSFTDSKDTLIKTTQVYSNSKNSDEVDVDCSSQETADSGKGVAGIGHSSFVDENNYVSEDGNSIIPYLDPNESSSTGSEMNTTEIVGPASEQNASDTLVKVDFLRKGLTELFWDSEEGQAYLTGGEKGYQECVQRYQELAATVLGVARIAEQKRLQNRNVHHYVTNYLKTVTLPRSLPLPHSKRDPPELPVILTGEELLRESLGTQPLSQVEINRSMRNQLHTVATETMHAAACANFTFTSREELRRVTVPTTYKLPYARHILVTPTKVKLGTMLAPADLTTARISFKNIGHMPVHLRYDLLYTEKNVEKEERIIKDVCMTQNKGGIPPGMTATVILKIKTPIPAGPFNTIAFFKTEEEVIAVPIEGVVQSGSPRSTLNNPYGIQRSWHKTGAWANSSGKLHIRTTTAPINLAAGDRSSSDE